MVPDQVWVLIILFSFAACCLCDRYQDLSADDLTPPTIDLHCPADAVLTVDEHCDADIDGVALATASFEDNCELDMTGLGYEDAVTDSISEGCYTITHTWTATATDACGNSSSETCSQTITIKTSRRRASICTARPTSLDRG